MLSFLEMDWMSVFACLFVLNEKWGWGWIWGVCRSKTSTRNLLSCIDIQPLVLTEVMKSRERKDRTETQGGIEAPGVTLSWWGLWVTLCFVALCLPPSWVELTEAGSACLHACSGQWCSVVQLHGFKWYKLIKMVHDGYLQEGDFTTSNVPITRKSLGALLLNSVTGKTTIIS